MKLVDWTGRQIRKGKSGQIPADCARILDRLQCDAETWLDFVVNFRKRFRNAAGLAPVRFMDRRHGAQQDPSLAH